MTRYSPLSVEVERQQRAARVAFEVVVVELLAARRAHEHVRIEVARAQVDDGALAARSRERVGVREYSPELSVTSPFSRRPRSSGRRCRRGVAAAARCGPGRASAAIGRVVIGIGVEQRLRRCLRLRSAGRRTRRRAPIRSRRRRSRRAGGASGSDCAARCGRRRTALRQSVASWPRSVVEQRRRGAFAFEPRIVAFAVVRPVDSRCRRSPAEPAAGSRQAKSKTASAAIPRKAVPSRKSGHARTS